MSRVRGIVHAHSAYSYDSSTPLSAVREVARSKSLSFVVQTEHSNEMSVASHRRFVDEARALSDDRFLLVPGIEFATSDNRIHVLVVGVTEFWEDLKLCPPERLFELLDRVRVAGGLSVLAHPERADAIERVPIDVLDRIDAVEVWNGKTDKLGPSPRGVRDVMRRRLAGRPAPALVGLDLHRPQDYRPVGVELERMPTGADDLVAMIRTFRYRAFFGPWRWNASGCGNAAARVGRASRLLIDAARAAKRSWKRLRPA